MPPTLITTDREEIRSFRAQHRDIILKPLYDNGEIKVALQTVAKLSSCNPCGEVWEVALRASSASILVNDGAQRCVSYETKGKSDTKGWQQCPYGSTSDAVVISVAGNQLQVKWGHDPRRATWGLWQGDTFVLSRSGN
jgi:hypothetical protein